LLGRSIDDEVQVELPEGPSAVVILHVEY
jgi:transcription elongation GreA/GreB family factor